MGATSKGEVLDALLNGASGKAREEPVLTPEEFKSPVWLKLKAHFEARVTKLRMHNDRKLGHDDTTELRGRIRELKNLSALDKPAPSIEESHAD